MRVLVLFSCMVTILLPCVHCVIRLPGQNVTKDTLTTLGIKTLGWQGEDEGDSPQVRVHHNYSKVSVQNQAVSSFYQSSSSQGKGTSQSSFEEGQHQGQQLVDEDDYFDLTSQTQGSIYGNNQQNSGFSQAQQTDFFPTQTSNNFEGQQKDDLDLDSQSPDDDQLQVQSELDQHQQSNSYSSQATFEGQQEDAGFHGQSNFDHTQQLESSLGSEQEDNGFHGQSNFDQIQQLGGQQEDDYGELFTSASSYDNHQIYNAHGYGNRLELDQVMQAENLNQQQFEDFPDYDIGQSQIVDQTAEASNLEPEGRQAKHFYPVDKPLYIHGFKYPPENVDPSSKQTPQVHTECPKMATGQFVHAASCNQFLNCWKGRGFVQNCAPGTLFNPKTLECDFASKVQCVTGPRKPEQNQVERGQKLEISCPAEYSGVVPHHTDCSKFINCASGVENVMDCPPGTLFSVKINNCDFPYRTECASWSVQFGNIKDYFWPSGGSSGIYQGQGNVNQYGQSGQKYTSTDDFRPHQGFGTDSKFNQGTWVATHASGTGQVNSNQGSWASAHGGGDSKANQNQGAWVETHGDVSSSDQLNSNQGSWTSGHGGASQQNLHGYGQGSSSNVYGQNSFGTAQNAVSGYGGPQQTTHGSSQGFYGSGDSQSGYGSGQNLHGATSQGLGGFRQHQGSYLGTQSQSSIGQNGKNQYQSADQGGYATNQQSYGNKNLHGGSQTSYDLSNSQSQYLYGQNHNQGQHGGQSLHEDGEAIYQQGVNKNTPSSSQFKGGRPKCPSEATGLFAHPSDCSKFLNCANGQTFVQDCGPGTVFNPTSKVCDFPYNVHCQQSEDYHHLINVRTESKVPVTQSTSSHGYYTEENSGTRGQNQGYHSSSAYQETIDSSGSSSKGQGHYSSAGGQKSTIESEEVKCPEHGSGLYPHPTICSKFLNCGSGQTFIQDCGPGTVFNPTSKVCDFPYNVECGGNYGEGLINIRQFPPINKTEGAWYNNKHQGSYGQNQIGDTSSGKPPQHYGQDGNLNQQHGSYGQNQIGDTSSGKTSQHYGPDGNLNQQGVHGQGQNQQHGSYGQNQIGDHSSGKPPGQGSNMDQQGQTSSWSSNWQGSYGQNSNSGGSTNQGGVYGQTSGTHQDGSATEKDFYVNKHQGAYGQKQGIGGSTTNQPGGSSTNQFYGQASVTDGNRLESSSGTDFYVQNSGVSNQGSHGQGMGGSTTNQQGGSAGFYGEGSVTNSNHQGSYGSSSSIGRQGAHGGNSQQQGSYGTASTNSQNQPGGSTWVDRNQQGVVGQNKIDDDQELQESKNFNQGQGLKPHHSPAPFPSTDINADYEFGSDGTTLEVGVQSKFPNSKRKDFCEPLDFHCNIDGCIPPSMVCDGVKDCPNGVDEHNCGKYLNEFAMTPNTILAVREKERYLNISLVYCAKSCLEAKSFQCKSFSYRKDDGACFLSDTNVGNSGALIISHPYNYFEAKTFTVNCTNLYKCPNHKCITFKQVCDGINDCGDRTDEKGCSAEAFGYQIRLGGTEKKHEGRIEIKAFGKWGYVCDDKFGLRDADVVCREVGFPLGSLEVKANSYYAQDLNDGDVFYLMDDVTCLGNETSVRNCDFNGWGVNNCEAQEVVGVVCKTPLENCPKDYWKCDSSQECIPLSFVCDEVFDCTDQSDERDHHCEAPIELRLANGKTKYEGRLEVRYHGIWGTVCDDDFNDESAKVVCKQLGHPGQAHSKKDGFFGAGDGPIWLDQVFCQGNESSLQHCVHWNWGEHNCEHAEDVGVICSNVEYADIGIERSVKLDENPQTNEVLPEYLFPERCGLRKDDQFLEDDAVQMRVVKGSGAKKGDYPWQASLRIKNTAKSTHWCGAVVISQKFVLTAAHCLAGFAKGAYFIVAGDYNTDDVEGTEQEAYIEEFYIHEDFRSGHKLNNDVAVIKLKGKGLAFTKDVQPICLPEADVEYDRGLNCTISGFGSIESGKSGYSHTLRAGWVPLQSREVCQMPHVYGPTLTEGMFCAGSLDEGIDACDGDSGGPLACLHDGLFTLFGLTSWGHHCGYANKPGVYAKVSHYRKWIDETIMKHSY